MLLYYICAGLILVLPVTGTSMATMSDQAQAYRKRLHPPLVRMIRSLEDELQSLSSDNSQPAFPEEEDQDFPTVTESSDIHFERNTQDFSKPFDSFRPTSLEGESNDGNKDFISNQAATEFLAASTPTPQFPDMEKTVSPSSSEATRDQPSSSKSAAATAEEKPVKSNVVEEDEEEDNDGSDEDNDADDDDDDEDDEEGNAEEERRRKSTTEAPTHVKNVYFMAKEEKHDEDDTKEVPDAVAGVARQDGAPETTDAEERDVRAKMTDAEGQDGDHKMAKAGRLQDDHAEEAAEPEKQNGRISTDDQFGNLNVVAGVAKQVDGSKMSEVERQLDGGPKIAEAGSLQDDHADGNTEIENQNGRIAADDRYGNPDIVGVVKQDDGPKRPEAERQDGGTRMPDANRQESDPKMTESVKQDGRILTDDGSDLAPEQDIDETLSDFEMQHANKSGGQVQDGNTNLSNNIRNSNVSTTQTEEELMKDVQNNAADGPVAPYVTDQYIYNAVSGDTSLEIDITAVEENLNYQESDENARNAEAAETYEGAGDSGNTSSAGWTSGRIVTPAESDKRRLEEEIMERLNSNGMEKRMIVKKSVNGHPRPINKLHPSGDSDENEDILQLMIRVAEDPKDWEEIRELLEKIQFDETTLRKAKSRLRALAKQQRIKNNRKNKTKGHDHVKHKLGKLLSRTSENDARAASKPQKQRQTPKNSGRQSPSSASDGRPNSTNKMPDISRVVLNKQKMRNYDPMSGNNGKGGYMKVSVFPAVGEDNNMPSGYKNHKFEQAGSRRNRPQAPAMGVRGEDFAIEKPVTVIGERSRVDPVEKELVEAATNQRIREIQREKIALAAAGLPTDEMEEQLKALTKLERRLKDHWRQKQTLLQKVRDKDQRRQTPAGPSMW